MQGHRNIRTPATTKVLNNTCRLSSGPRAVGNLLKLRDTDIQMWASMPALEVGEDYSSLGFITRCFVTMKASLRLNSAVK